MKSPEAHHPIVIEPDAGRVRVLYRSRVLADSEHALVMREADYPPVYYFPRTDVDLDAFEPSTHKSFCPYKGEAGYFHVSAGGTRTENVAWTYEDPLQFVVGIKDYVAFYPHKVDAIEQVDN